MSEGISLDAEALRCEVHEAPHYGDDEAVALSGLTDEQINTAIRDYADDAFWYAFDTLRSTVIDSLTRIHHEGV